jgi:branched-chain amino acid transport system permease protein
MSAVSNPISRSNARWPLLPRRGPEVSLFEIGLIALCLLLMSVRLSPNLQDTLILTFLWAGLALAWNIAGGFAGLISFGHAAFFGIGAYASTLLFLRTGLTPWVGMFAGGAMAAAFGAVLAFICARLSGPFFILSTLAAAEVARIGALNWASFTGGPEGLSIPPIAGLENMVFASKSAYAVLMFGFLIAVYAIAKWLDGSRFGYYLFAVRDDADAASAAGVDPLIMRAAAMALSAGLTGIGGSLFAQYFLYLDPTYVISPEVSFQFALLAAIGGMGSAIGPVLGSLLMTPTSELLRSYLGGHAAGLHLVIYSAVLIVVMLYAPSGIAGLLSRLSSRKVAP